MKKLLLHVCCGPCAATVVSRLRADYDVSGFFCNPNIQPRSEYEFRLREAEKLAAAQSWPLIPAPYEMKEWFAAVRGLEREPERGRRCPLCFRFRLERAFRCALARGFGVVATTLSISPYKAAAQINAEGQALAGRFGVDFLAADFKKRGGYDAARREARALGIRHQDYCGCAFSKAERLLRLRK